MVVCYSKRARIGNRLCIVIPFDGCGLFGAVTHLANKKLGVRLVVAMPVMQINTWFNWHHREQKSSIVSGLSLIGSSG